MKAGILKSVTNVINQNVYKTEKSIKNIDRFLTEFQKYIKNPNFYYLFNFYTDKLVFYLVNYESIELLDNSDVNFLKVIMKNDSNYNIDKIIDKFKTVPNNNLDDEKINLIRGTLVFMDKNPYYQDHFNNMIQHELKKLQSQNKSLRLIGGGILDTFMTYNTPFTELLASILATIPISVHFYNLLNLIIAISNGDKKGIGLSVLGFIPGFVGKLIKFGNLIRISYKYYNNKNNNTENTDNASIADNTNYPNNMNYPQ